jgi:hypothetical protein
MNDRVPASDTGGTLVDNSGLDISDLITLKDMGH